MTEAKFPRQKNANQTRILRKKIWAENKACRDSVVRALTSQQQGLRFYAHFEQLDINQ